MKYLSLRNTTFWGGWIFVCFTCYPWSYSFDDINSEKGKIVWDEHIRIFLSISDICKLLCILVKWSYWLLSLSSEVVTTASESITAVFQRCVTFFPNQVVV